jgi:hypothetical protein
MRHGGIILSICFEQLQSDRVETLAPTLLRRKSEHLQSSDCRNSPCFILKPAKMVLVMVAVVGFGAGVGLSPHR